MTQESTLFTHTVPEETPKKRLDAYLHSLWAEDFSRARLQALMKEEHLTVNGAICTQASYKVSVGDVLDLDVPPAEPTHIEPEEIPLDILFEDEHLIVLHKPAGLTVHPAPGNTHGTLVNALLHHCPHVTGIGGVDRPGIVHRLDKETSGTMVIAKDDKAHRELSAAFKDRTIHRRYQALCYGVFKPRAGMITGNIGRSPRNRKKMGVLPHGGKEAVTHYTTLQTFKDVISLMEFKLETGRTHQIRVHAQHAGHNVVGDPVYGRHKKFAVLPPALNEHTRRTQRQMLHAAELGFTHPHTGEELFFTAPLPEDFQALLDALKNVC